MTDAYSMQQVLGNYIAQTAPSGDKSNRVATTRYVLNAIASAASLAKVSITGQTTSISTTVLYTATATGLYIVSWYFDTNSTPSSLNATFFFTDDNAARSHSTAVLSTSGFEEGQLVAMVAGSTISFLTTLSGSATYSFFANVQGL